MNDQPSPTTGDNQLHLIGQRIIKNLKDAGMIEEPEPKKLSMLDFIIKLKQLVSEVSDEYYDNREDHATAITKLRDFVGLDHDW